MYRFYIALKQETLLYLERCKKHPTGLIRLPNKTPYTPNCFPFRGLPITIRKIWNTLFRALPLRTYWRGPICRFSEIGTIVALRNV